MNLAELCNPNYPIFLVGLFENWFRRSFIFGTFVINSGPPGWIREIKLSIFQKHQLVDFEEGQDCQDCENDQDRENDQDCEDDLDAKDCPDCEDDQASPSFLFVSPPLCFN